MTTAAIKFKTKVKDMWNAEETTSRKFIEVPEFKRNHCDMAFFRKHRRYRSLANSDLFPNVLKRLRRDMLPNQYSNIVYLDSLPVGWSVNEMEFLARVSINVE